MNIDIKLDHNYVDFNNRYVTFKFTGNTVKELLKYIEKTYKITAPRIRLYNGKKSLNHFSDSLIIKNSTIKVKPNIRRGIYVKWNNEWISDIDGEYHNFYKNCTVDDDTHELPRSILYLKKIIKEHIHVKDDIELVYLNGQTLNDNDLVHNIFGYLGQDIIVRLKYEKYVSITLFNECIFGLDDLFKSGFYYKGPDNKHKMHKIKNGKIVKIKATVIKSDKEEDNACYSFDHFINKVNTFKEKLKNIPEYKWFEEYELYKVKEWSLEDGEYFVAYCFKINKK